MNKEVIYLEPEDDITDILTKLQQAEQKLVAIVPPKKATTLRSTVNMKLVARVAKECDKIVVIVTADPAIMKMAMAARIPVAKTLNSRPIIPNRDSLASAEQNVAVIDEATGEITSEPSAAASTAPEMPGEAPSEPQGASSPYSAADIELDEETLENAENEPISSPSDAKSAKTAVPPHSEGNFFQKHLKWFAIGIPVVLIAVVLLVWAFVFAPSASIAVAISSSPSNFSENIRFTTVAEEAAVTEGLFYASTPELEQKYTSTITATGEENRGEHASGSVVVSIAFVPRATSAEGFYYAIGEGTVLMTATGHDYVVTSGGVLSWDGDELPSGCTSMNRSCTVSTSVDVTAAAAGEEYNLLSSTTWQDYQGLSITNSTITGGTDDIVKVVSQEDIDQAATALLEQHQSEGKKMLLEDINTDYLPIEASFKAEIIESTSEPAVGEALEGTSTSANLSVKVRYTVYAIERSALTEFIKGQLSLAEDQRLYSVSSAYIERYTEITEAARLKAVVEIGPIVTEDIIFDKARGRKIGEVSSILRSINGVSSVEISTPYFWVWSIPDDREKVTITISVEDKN